MENLQQLVDAFSGQDPLAGEDACQALIRYARGGPARSKEVLDRIIPLDPEASVPFSSFHAEFRFKRFAAALGADVLSHLAEAIADGPWGSKTRAAPCFAALPRVAQTYAPLIDILKRGGDFDAERNAIAALGYAGADEWNFMVMRYAKTGRWQEGDPRETVDPYSFGKLSPNAVEALARFAARAEHAERTASLVRQLGEFIRFRQEESPNVAPDAYTIAAGVAREFGPGCMDAIIGSWGGHRDVRLQTLCMEILREMAPLRAAKFLLEAALDPGRTEAVRHGASVALGEIRHPQAAERLAKFLPASGDGALSWAVSSLHAVADWKLPEKLARQLMESDSEPGAHFRYSMALRGETVCRDALIDRLDHSDPYQRWTSALALARLLGPQARRYLDQRAKEASDPIERCATCAAAIASGDLSRSGELHAALQSARVMPQLRSIWKLEILDAFRIAEGPASRAFKLWAEAVRVGDRQLNYFDELRTARRSAGSGPVTDERPAPPARPDAHHKLFISYSRRDREWLDAFKTMLSPLIRSERLSLWEDSRITPGKWQPQIEQAMQESHVALLLVSANFLASEFIMRHELPGFLKFAEERGLVIIWVLLEECLWEETALSSYQGENTGRALGQMEPADRTKFIKETCQRIRSLLPAR